MQHASAVRGFNIEFDAQTWNTPQTSKEAKASPIAPPLQTATTPKSSSNRKRNSSQLLAASTNPENANTSPPSPIPHQLFPSKRSKQAPVSKNTLVHVPLTTLQEQLAPGMQYLKRARPTRTDTLPSESPVLPSGSITEATKQPLFTQEPEHADAA